jgi:hypothetical protein
MNIFVEGDVTLEGLVDILKGMLDIHTVLYNPEEEAPYELYEEHTLILVGENTYFNGDGINFEDFHYEIDVRGFAIRDASEEIAHKHQRAEYIFSRLKETGKFRLMLAFDAQAKQEEFIPPQFQQPPSEYALKSQQLPTGVRIYVETAEPMLDFAHELESLLHTTAKERTGTWEKIWYLLNDGKADFYVMRTKTLGNYIIDVKGRVFIPGERRYWQFESARQLYEQLKATNKYVLRLADGRKNIIEEFSPTPEAS